MREILFGFGSIPNISKYRTAYSYSITLINSSFITGYFPLVVLLLSGIDIQVSSFSGALLNFDDYLLPDFIKNNLFYLYINYIKYINY